MYTRVPGASRVAWKQDSKQSHWVSVFSPLSLSSPSPLLRLEGSNLPFPISFSLIPIFTSLSPSFLSLLHPSSQLSLSPHHSIISSVSPPFSLSPLPPFSLSSSFSHPISTRFCTIFCLQFLSFLFLSPHLSLFFCLSSLVIVPNLSPVFLYLLSTHFPLCHLSLLHVHPIYDLFLQTVSWLPPHSGGCGIGSSSFT